ncbi:MAG: mechanosensitive ion channel domain-containing protein [Rhodomicrobium sp.]
MGIRARVFVSAIFAFVAATSFTAEAQTLLPSNAAPKPAAPAPAVATSAHQVDMASIFKKANDATALNVEAKIKTWRGALERIEQGLRDPKLEYKALNDYRSQLLALRADGEAFWRKLEPALNSANEDSQALPPAPAQGQPSELEQTAIVRQETGTYVSYLKSARTTLDETQNRINKLIGAILDIRRARVANNLSQRMPGIFSAETWQGVPQQAQQVFEKVRSAIADWWNNQEQDQIAPLAAIGLALWLGLSLLGWFGVRWLRQCDGEPPFWRRASTAAGVILLRSLPTVVPLVFLFNAVDQVQAFPNEIDRLFYYGARSILIVAVVRALVATVLSPGDHRWRLIPASNAAAVRVSGLTLTLALLYGAATFMLVAVYVMKAPETLRVAVSLPTNLAVGLLMIAILQTPLRQADAAGLPSISWLGAVRLPILLIAIAIIATALAGYLALSRFIAQQLIVTGTILAIVYLLLLWADGIAQAIGSESSGAGSWLGKTAGLDQAKRQRLAVPTSLLLKFVILVCAVPLILNQWQFPWADILEWYRQLFFGFRIGNTQISLGAIIASIVVFILGYFAAKLFQQWLDTQVLKPAGLSGGLRDSISTTVGYLGVFAAALIALSYAGFNLSNLALVAGAFSVGIGFGLQSVVSNFVSGLILLAERPIKVGDLVVVGGEEGYVRKISVRSTEIETFDRANVLIPNSFFITEKVKNWTLRNNTGRVAIAVGVAYGCDPRKVKTILLQLAQAHPNVMRTPEPFVDFEDFASDTLNFKLYAYIYDLTTGVATRTDLRIAILDAFNAAGIVIPSRQTDVTVRDIDWLRDAVKQYLANAYGNRISGNGSEASLEQAK